MESPDLGPKWAWSAALILACIGIVAVLGGIVSGIVWLAKHITIQ